MPSASETLHHRRYIYGLLMAGLGSVLFSGKAILIKLAFSYGANAETLIALRMLMALPLFWGIFWWHSRKQFMSPLTWRDQVKIFVLGFMGYFLSSYLDFLGLQYISVGLERIVLYLTPTIVLLISYFVLNKSISRLQWYALAVGYLGVIAVFIQDASSTGSLAVPSKPDFIFRRYSVRRSTRRTAKPQLCAMSVALDAQGETVPKRGLTTITGPSTGPE